MSEQRGNLAKKAQKSLSGSARNPPGEIGNEKHAHESSRSTVHTHPILKLLQENLDENDQMVGLDLHFLWHDITLVSKPDEI